MTSQKIVIFQIFLCFCVSFSTGYDTSYISSLRFGNENSTIGLETTTEESKRIVKISVYYETLCPASVDFFTSQLRPAVESLGSHLDIHLIPYGHARTRVTSRQYRFRCQHGPEECYGNKLHACVIDVMHNTTRSVLLNACLMQYTHYVPYVGYDYAAALIWCGYKMNITYEGVRQCVTGHRGNLLLKQYGEETHRLNPHYVPYVVVDESSDSQSRVTENLVSVICQKLDNVPMACRKT